MTDETKPAGAPSGEPAEPGPAPLLSLGTRIALYYILIVIIQVVGTPLLAMLFLGPERLKEIAAGRAELDFGLQLGLQAVLLPVVIVATLGFVRLVDRKPLWAIGALWPPGTGRRALPQVLAAAFGAGILLGGWYLLVGLVARFTAPESGELVSDGRRLLLWGLGFLAAATLDEWILRGYLFSTLRERLSWVNAGAITALLYVLWIAANPGVGAPGLFTAFLLGLMMAALREMTGSLWPAAVFQGTWNFVMGCVLSLPVSGITVPGLLRHRIEGSETWSGGSYGPEGSWLMVGLLVLGVTALGAAASGGGSDAGESVAEGDD